MHHIDQWNEYLSCQSPLRKFTQSLDRSYPDTSANFTRVMSTNDARMVSWCSLVPSETNDSADYLRLLNSTWNDHLVRSVSDERDRWSKEPILSCSISRLWFVNYSLFSIGRTFYMQQYRAFGKWRSRFKLEMLHWHFQGIESRSLSSVSAAELHYINEVSVRKKNRQSNVWIL